MKRYFFPVVMCLLTVLTVAKYRSIVAFKNESEEFTFVVSVDKSEISDVKNRIQNYTFQAVDDEMIGDGLYKLTVRCPPDKIGFIKNMMSRFSEGK